MEKENKSNIVEQGISQSVPEDAKTKFHRMVREAQTTKPVMSGAEITIQQSPGSPRTTRDLNRDAKMFSEESQEEHRLPEQRQSKAEAAKHFQEVADKNQEMVNLRLGQLSPEEQKSWTEEQDRLDRTIAAMETRLHDGHHSPEDFRKYGDELDKFKKQREEWEAKLPSLKSMAP